MFTAAKKVSSMTLDGEVLLDKQQASFNAKTLFLDSTNIGTNDLSSLDASVNHIKNEPILKETPDTETNQFLVYNTKSDQSAITKWQLQTLQEDDDVKGARRYQFLSKSEPVIYRGISHQHYTDYNNNNNSRQLSRSLKHDVPRIVVTNPLDKNDWDGVILRNPVSKFISRYYGHNSYHGDVLANHRNYSEKHLSVEEIDQTYSNRLQHSTNYGSCTALTDSNVKPDTNSFFPEVKNSKDPQHHQLSRLDLLVRRNGFRISRNSRSLDSGEWDQMKRTHERGGIEHGPYQSATKKKGMSVGNCFRSVTTSTSSENADYNSHLPVTCTRSEDNCTVKGKLLRRSYQMAPTENIKHYSPLRKTCPPDILRKVPGSEFECDSCTRTVNSSINHCHCNKEINNTPHDCITNNFSNSTSQKDFILSQLNSRTPSPTTVSGCPRSESRKSFQTICSSSSKRARSPCQRTIERVSLTSGKCRSEPDLELAYKRNKGKNNFNSSSLKNIFLPSSPSAMQKAKSSPSNKILSKRWRNKYKGNPNNTTAIWRPEGYCTWSSVGGRKVVLHPTNILGFSKTAEQTALRHVALSKVQDIIPGCSVVIPKAYSDVKRHKKTMMKKRSQSVNLGGLLEHLTQKDRDKSDKDDPQPMGLVFGIPVSRCITNDNELRKRRQQNFADNANEHKERNQSSSSHGSTENLPRQNGNSFHSGNTANNRSFHAGSSDSLSESDASSRHTGGSTNLIDALSLSMTGRDSLQNDTLEHLNSEGPMVPRIVTTCFKHIETYGFHVLGIFRVGSSKKRVKQLRDEFDSGKDVVLDDKHNPHDVGALLKEYFRDLPEPLLTRDLYSPFVATRRIQCPEQQALAVKLLVALLPVPIRDTLWALVKFLKKVAEHSMDSIGENGEVLPGNKMDSTNLATLFGPNILHKAKSSGEREYLVESTARAEERKEVIEVVKSMIDNNTSMFEISAEIYDDVLRQIMEDDSEACDRHLKLLASDFGVDTDLDTSYSSVFNETNYHQSPQHYASASDILQSSRTASGSNISRPILRQTASTSSSTHYPTSDSDRDDTDPRQGLSDYHDRQARRILRQRGKQSPAKILTTSPPSSTAGGLRVPGVVRLPQRSLSSDKDSRTMQTTTLTIPQQSSYLRQNSCPGLSSSPPPSASPPVSPIVPFSRPLGSTCSRPGNPVDNKGSRSERELSQTGRTRQLTRSRDASPMDKPKVSSTSLSTAFAESGKPNEVTSLQHGQPSCPVPKDGNLIRSAAWQRERWRQWEILTTESSDETHEQETLV